MRARERWRPSKFVYKEDRLTGSRDPSEVGVGSRLITDLIASIYDENLREHARGKLLDLGCGSVPLYATYKDRVSEIVCVDWGNILHGAEYLDLHCDLTGPLPLADGSFDTIILSDVLEHIPEPAHLWTEMSRVLSKGGKLLLNVPFYYWIHEQPHDYYRYTEYALRRFVESSGLKLIHLSPIGGSPEIAADLFAKNAAMLLGHLGVLLATLAQWMTAAFIKTRFGAKVSAVTAHRFPLGYFLVAEKP